MTPPTYLLASAALLAGVAFPAAAQEGEITLRIAGASGTAFSAGCTLKTAAGAEEIAIDQSVPFEATYVGTGMSCNVTAEGPIEVEVAKGGSSSRTRISGGVARVNVGS